MFKNNWLTILKKQRFNFGDRPIDQYVVFECKYLFGIMFFCFRKSENVQDRFHTHAFRSVSFKLCGSYDEHRLDYEGNEYIIPRTKVVQFFERNIFHKIGKSSEDTWTILLMGPWRRTWTEYYQNNIFKDFTWGRQPK